MPLNGNTFTRLQSWAANAALGIKIRADLMDQDTNDIANGIGTVSAAAAQAQATAAQAQATANGAPTLVSLASPAGSTSIGWIQTGLGAVLRKLNIRLQDDICFDDFGADPTGATDSSAAFARALVRWVGGTTSSRLRGSPGAKYLIANVVVSAPGGSNFSSGQQGLVLDLSGITLLAAATQVVNGGIAATRLLTIGVEGDPAVTWTNGVKLVGPVTLDLTNLPNVAGNYGLVLTNAYNGSISDVVSINTPSNVVDIAVLKRAYTYNFKNIFAAQLHLLGKNVATDAITSLVLDNVNVNLMKCDGSWNINWLNLVVQSAAGSKIILSNGFNLNFYGGDTEGAAGTVFDFTGGGVSGFWEQGMNVSGALTYCVGTAARSYFGSRNRFTNGVVGGKPLLNITTTAATPIYTFLGDILAAGKPAGAFLFLVTGDDGNRGFIDVVAVAFSTAITVAAAVGYGAGQPTRTYTVVGNQLLLQLSAVAANNVVVSFFGNPT